MTMNLMESLIGGIRMILAGGVEQPFRAQLDLVDMGSQTLPERLRLTVTGIMGKKIAGTLTTDQVLAYDAATNKWQITDRLVTVSRSRYGVESDDAHVLQLLANNDVIRLTGDWKAE